MLTARKTARALATAAKEAFTPRAAPRRTARGRPTQLNSTQQRTGMWANAQRDGRPVKYRWLPLVNAAKFG